MNICQIDRHNINGWYCSGIMTDSIDSVAALMHGMNVQLYAHNGERFCKGNEESTQSPQKRAYTNQKKNA